MKGQIEVRFITAITIALAVLFSAITINSIATKGPDEDLTAADLATMYQITRVADEYTGEALSYAYYREVNRAFNPRSYSNPNEQWDVPDWFKYPTKNTTASCATVDKKLGCVIWNIRGGADNKHPCPEPVESYVPDPTPADIFSRMQLTDLNDYFIEALKEVNVMIATGTTEGGTTYGLHLFGKGISIKYDTKLTANGNKTINADGNVNVAISDGLGEWTLEVNRLTNTNMILTAEMKYVDHSEYKAGQCICKEEGGTMQIPKVIGRYKMREYYIEVTVKNKNTGEVITEGNISYIKYFTGWAYKPIYDGVKKYNECELVVP